jgi:hypothetical protein
MKADADGAGPLLSSGPRTTAYRIAFGVAAAFALARVASALSIQDADAAATIPSRRHHAHWSEPAVARVWHHPAANQATVSPRRVYAPGETTDSQSGPRTKAGADAV